MTRQWNCQNAMMTRDAKSGLVGSTLLLHSRKDDQNTPSYLKPPRRRAKKRLQPFNGMEERATKRLRAAENKRLLRAAKRDAQRIRNPSFEIIDINNLSSPCSTDPALITDNPVPSSAEKGIQSGLGLPPRRVTDFGVGAAGVSSGAPTVSWHRIPTPGDSSAFPARVVLPYIPDGPEDLVQLLANDVRSDASCHPILEDTNEHIVFIRPPFPDDMQLIDIILDHLAQNRGVKLEGFRKSEIIETLTSDYMTSRWNVQPARLVEVHDTFQSIKNPAKPFKKMLHREFIDGLTDPTRSEKILDVPMSHRGVPSFWYDWPHGLSREQWGDANWGLLHHALTWTEEHHDGDGKIALIARRTGPSGAVHAVYTPEPSFTRGASFWSLATMHQVEASRSYDVEGGIWSTNLDHGPERVYEAVVRMMLYLPTNPDKLRYKRSLASFLLMVLDPVSAYGFPVGEDEAAERTAQGLPHLSVYLTYLKTFLATGAALSDPGEKISLSGILNEILQEEKKKRKEEEE
ncbi:hypothetical protein ARMGADRAFT_1040931 [Armillaria gallica]|uniref:Uncharacterized protein n=1 Tax=Armillaria gallica TaxID=47427 RepID=A0A2H3CLK6_ARMGA|nr:hypothetical protein ARMGADRAFT_1040931 [Armillaria gallica]